MRFKKNKNKKKTTTGDYTGKTKASFRWHRLRVEAEDGSATEAAWNSDRGCDGSGARRGSRGKGLRARDAIPSSEHKSLSTATKVWGGRGASKVGAAREPPPAGRGVAGDCCSGGRKKNLDPAIAIPSTLCSP